MGWLRWPLQSHQEIIGFTGILPPLKTGLGWKGPSDGLLASPAMGRDIFTVPGSSSLAWDPSGVMGSPSSAQHSLWWPARGAVSSQEVTGTIPVLLWPFPGQGCSRGSSQWSCSSHSQQFLLLRAGEALVEKDTAIPGFGMCQSPGMCSLSSGIIIPSSAGWWFLSTLRSPSPR